MCRTVGFLFQYKMAELDHLPVEILQIIILQLPFRDRLAMARVSEHHKNMTMTRWGLTRSIVWNKLGFGYLQI